MIWDSLTSASDKQFIFCIIGSLVAECSLAERGRHGFVSLPDTTYITKDDDSLDDGLDDDLGEDKDGVTEGKARYELYFGLRNSDEGRQV